MRQRNLILIPVLTLSFLASCSKPAPSPSPDPKTTYEVTFNSKGGSYIPEAQTIISGGQVNEPNKPTKDDFTFGGWYTDEEAIEYKYDFSRPVVTNLTLYAKWDKIDNLVTVTFDAKDGLYSDTSRYVCFSIPVGSKLYPYINIMKKFEPVASNKTFACYSYKDNGAIIDYNDVVNSDITLEANYLLGAPYSNLDAISWDYIKQVAVTKNDISEVFIIGATKTVILYNQPHLVRTIGYNHDKLASDSNEDIKTGLTFEFANLITKEDKTSYITHWDEKGTNVFIGSTFYTLLNGEPESKEDCIFNNLPNDLKDVMQLVEKYVGVGFGKDKTPVRDSAPYNTKLFPLAHDEIVNPVYDDQPEGEGTLYDYYKLHKDDATYRVKACVGGDSEPYWLRSPHCSWYLYYPDAWMVHDSTGNLAGRVVCETDQVDKGIAIAPAFCI